MTPRCLPVRVTRWNQRRLEKEFKELQEALDVAESNGLVVTRLGWLDFRPSAIGDTGLPEVNDEQSGEPADGTG